MGILNLKYIEESDSELTELRERFANEFEDVEVGQVYPERASVRYHRYYYIQIKPQNFPPHIHFEYWTDSYEGYLDLHLEPQDRDETRLYGFIGNHLMHLLSDYGIEPSEWRGLTNGCFRINGIYEVNDLVEKFAEFYSLVKQPLLEIYETKKGASPLTLNYPSKTIEYKPLGNPTDDVSVGIMTLSEVMELNLTLPSYQRDYCWEDHNIIDLWNNLKKIKNGQPFHLGTIIFHDYQNQYNIIDGQQRLITLSIILLGLGYKRYLPLLTASYDSLDAQNHIANCKSIVKTLINKEKDTQKIAALLAENVSFAVLTVNEANLDLAYTFFSNQNSKGVPLSDFDLLKAHHLRFIPNDGQAEHMATKWNALTMLPPIYGDKNALYRTLGTHLYRLRRWRRKNESYEGENHFIQREYQAAPTMNDIPPFGEKFDFYEKIQGGTHFFVYAETFIHRYQEFLNNNIVKTLQQKFEGGALERYSDAVETVLFAYYLKFGNQYLAEALYCILQLTAIYRYNKPRDSWDGTSFRSFINNGTELVLMIDQASSPTFFLAEAIEKFNQLVQKEEYQITSRWDLPENKGIRVKMYEAIQSIYHEILTSITETSIRNQIIEEYGWQ